jgi:hypothetical protein
MYDRSNAPEYPYAMLGEYKKQKSNILGRTIAQAVSRRHLALEPGPVHVGFVVGKVVP